MDKTLNQTTCAFLIQGNELSCQNPVFMKKLCRYHYAVQLAKKNTHPFARAVKKVKNAMGVKKTKKVKLRPIRALVKDLDKVFSLFIRLRYADKNGMVTCFTSGKVMHYKEAHAGHWISRRHYATRWDERNVQVQSVADNIFNQGAGAEFAGRLIQKYGVSVIDLLLAKKNAKFKLERFFLEELCREYTTKVIELQAKLEIN